MAEKSSELDNLDETGAKITNDTALEKRTDDYSMTETDTNDAVTDTDDADLEAEQMRERIEETRRGMGETIDAIQEKLSFSNISEQVKDQVSEQIGSAVESVKSAAFDKAGDFMKVFNKGFKEIKKSDIVKTATQYPWILGLVGLGVGALLVNNLTGKKKKKNYSSYRYKSEQDFDDEVKYSDSYRRELKSGEAEDSTRQTTRNKVGDAASSAYESVAGAASTAYDGVSSAAGTAYESVGSAAVKTYKGVGSAAGYAADKAGDLGGQVKTNYDYYIEENPLAVGAVALALGAAVGFAIPLTKTENEYMGEMRDNLVEKAQTSAEEAIGAVKQIAGDAQKVIFDEVKSKTA